MRVVKLWTHHGAVREDIRVVFIDKFFYPHLPQFEHFRAPVGEQRQFLQHHVSWDTDLLAQVQA